MTTDVVTLTDRDLSNVKFVTTHFNIGGFERTSKTFFEWYPTLGPVRDRLEILECTYDGVAPELPATTVIEGRSKLNKVWQKEALINLAISRMPAEIDTVGWLDHDMVAGDPLWIDKALWLLDNGYDAVQLCDRIAYLSQTNTVNNIMLGRAAYSNENGTNPGANWIIRREAFELAGGLYPFEPFGGGDQVFWANVGCQSLTSPLYRHTLPSLRSVINYILKGVQLKVGYLQSPLYHLWHGDQTDRQYVSRHEILNRIKFDPDTQLAIGPNGLVELIQEGLSMSLSFASYFKSRKEDG